MAQVDSENTTPMPVDPTRRRFLSTTAALAAGTAALALAIPPALATDDPIFVAIEAHKAMTAALIATLDEQARLEGAAGSFDDGRVEAAHNAEEAALTELVETIPTTLGGVIASMAYITEAAEKDYCRYSEDWLQPLIANLCEALKSLSGQEGGSDAEA